MTGLVPLDHRLARISIPTPIPIPMPLPMPMRIPIRIRILVVIAAVLLTVRSAWVVVSAVAEAASVVARYWVGVAM